MDLVELKFGHLTDIHLPIREKPGLWALLNKRALGYLSWRRRRSGLHKQAASDVLAADLRARSCDAAIISGDIVNIALPSEFRDARRWMDDRFEGAPAIFAPGNHDTYVKTEWRDTLGLLAGYMTGARSARETEREATGFDDFPFLRQIPGEKDIAFVVANSAPPTAPGLASGRLGADQIERIGRLLKEAGEQGQFRVLVLHHPINDGVVSSRKGLDDRALLREMISKIGVDLVLHGHTHFPVFASVETPDGLAPVIGGGSASHSRARGKYRAARYNLFSLSRPDDGGWLLSLDIRELDPETNEVVTIETHSYVRPSHGKQQQDSRRRPLRSEDTIRERL